MKHNYRDSPLKLWHSVWLTATKIKTWLVKFEIRTPFFNTFE